MTQWGINRKNVSFGYYNIKFIFYQKKLNPQSFFKPLHDQSAHMPADLQPFSPFLSPLKSFLGNRRLLFVLRHKRYMNICKLFDICCILWQLQQCSERCCHDNPMNLGKCSEVWWNCGAHAEQTHVSERLFYALFTPADTGTRGKPPNTIFSC